MRSFIFSSDNGDASARLDLFTIGLLLTSLAAVVVTEGISIIAVDRTSKVLRAETAQRRALVSVRDGAVSETSHIAVLGNSLLLNGINVPLLAEKIEPKFSAVPYFVLGAEYYDWFYGLRRLFSEGMRPKFVLLGLSPSQLVSPNTRGDFSARYLFQGRDLLAIIRETHMDPTSASGFVLAHFSEFYSTREMMRASLINWLLPNVGELLHNKLSVNRAPEIQKAILRQLGGKRLTALDHLCRANGSVFILVIPPTYEAGAETIAEIGREQNQPVLIPIASQHLDATFYQSDGYHLNERGATIFTSRLAENLLERMVSLTIPQRTSR